MRRLLWGLAVVGLLPAAGAAQPAVNFALGPLGVLPGAHACDAEVHVAGWFWDGTRWRSGGGARLYRFDRVDYKPNGRVKTRYHGLGFCAPVDLEPGRTCGQFDQLGQEEVAQVTPPAGTRLTGLWLSEIVGNDAVDVGGSDVEVFDPAGVTWFARAVAGEGPFNAGVPCVGEPTEGVRPCDAIEGRLPIPPDQQGWRHYWVRGVPGARRAFVVWGVDTAPRVDLR